jgi:hypothetical protein
MTPILRLWSDELEEARPETRAAVAAGISMFSDRGTLGGLPREERVARRRAGMIASHARGDGAVHRWRALPGLPP